MRNEEHFLKTFNNHNHNISAFDCEAVASEEKFPPVFSIFLVEMHLGTAAVF